MAGHGCSTRITSPDKPGTRPRAGFFMPGGLGLFMGRAGHRGRAGQCIANVMHRVYAVSSDSAYALQQVRRASCIANVMQDSAKPGGSMYCKCDARENP